MNLSNFSKRCRENTNFRQIGVLFIQENSTFWLYTFDIVNALQKRILFNFYHFFLYKTTDSIGEISRRHGYITLLFSLILTFNKMAMTKLSNTNLKGVGFILSLAIQSRICSLCMFLNKFIKAFGTQKKFRVDLSENDSSSYFN